VTDLSWAVKALGNSLVGLASDPETQMRRLASFAVPVDVDELVLEMSDVDPLIPQLVQQDLISTDMARAMRDLRCQLDRMSGKVHPELWTEKALRSSEEWSTVRKLARAALVQMPGDWQK
jgi:hypothetical protein